MFDVSIMEKLGNGEAVSGEYQFEEKIKALKLTIKVLKKGTNVCIKENGKEIFNSDSSPIRESRCYVKFLIDECKSK